MLAVICITFKVAFLHDIVEYGVNFLFGTPRGLDVLTWLALSLG